MEKASRFHLGRDLKLMGLVQEIPWYYNYALKTEQVFFGVDLVNYSNNSWSERGFEPPIS